MRRSPRRCCRRCCQKGADKTFNCVTVDSDTSTSRHAAAVSPPARPRKRGAPADHAAERPPPHGVPAGARTVCCSDLAQQVARDGEGARKFVDVKVTGAKRRDVGQAHRAVDRQFAAGQDGDRRRGRQLGPRRHGGRQGRRAGRPRQARDLVRRHPRRAQGRARSGLRRGQDHGLHEAASEITIRVDLGLGRGEATVWTCDLTKEYVEINGDYRS